MVRSNRTIANLASAIDSGTTNEFLGLGDSGVLFEPVAYADISNKPTILDSAATIALFDSAYVANRQLGGGIDSAGVTGIIDSAYVQARTAGGGLDSAKMTNLIDSAYITARVTSGLDSAGITGLVDSSYVTDRFSANSGFDWYLYTATAGQTVFDSIDDNGETLSYSEDGILVFYNGILMLKTYDYTATDGTSITLTTAADSGANVAVVKYGIGGSVSVSASANGDWYGDRAIVAGGILSGSRTDTIQYYDISTLGNAADFGNLSAVRNSAGSLTGDGGTRALFAGGKNSSNAAVNIMEYVTTTTAGNATDYGDMRMGGGNGPSSENIGVSSGTRGVFKIGLASGTSYANYISYVTVATPQNAYDFGDATSNSGRHLGGASDGTYGLWAGGGISGIPGTENKPIDYITIATAGNASDFGDLVTARGYQAGGCSSLTRGLFAGGYDKTNSTNTIEYVTIATPGNATDFGDMNIDRIYCSASSNSLRGTFNGGTSDWLGTGTKLNSIEYVSIDTTGNGTDFGDLLGTTEQHTATSGHAA